MDRIMVVDDEPVILRAVELALESEDIEVETYSDPEDAIKRLRVANFDLVISDYRMPAMNGVDFLCTAKSLQPDSMRMVLSGKADIDALIAAINQADIFRFVIKPWENEQLVAMVKQALELRNALMENRRLANELREQKAIIGKYRSVIERLEAQEPGITKVNWAEDGSIIINDER
jgi:DNA-binding NtrC family response regulator